VVTRLLAPRLLVDGRFTGRGQVVVDGGRIRSIGVLPDGAPAPGDTDVLLGDGFLTPGLLDLQINGAFGVDFAEAGPQDWQRVREGLLATGVTGFAPTLITAPLTRLAHTLLEIGTAADEPCTGARILGVHVEGPFLSPDYHGAHDPALMADPTPQALDVLLDGPAPAVITLAPERPHALSAIERLTAAGSVVSIGHTAATAAQVHAAADAGARMVTHVFNAQRALGHREPGTAGAALTDPRLTVGMIADLQHITGEVVGLVFRAAAGRVALVTDAVAAMGVGPQHRTALGGSEIFLDAQGLPRRSDGTIAGSVLRLDQAVRNAVGCGVDPAAALDAVTRTPADLLDRQDLGRLRPGAAADLVWWGEDLQIREVWVGGIPTISTRLVTPRAW
jgi:N-acetylglucosamine-6-phosphate deacetylase